MVRKLKSAGDKVGEGTGGKAGGGLGARQGSALAGAVKESAQQIWLAGLGAFSKAQTEGGKVFETLVKDGTHLQKKTQGMAADKINEMSGRISAMADSVSAKAGQNWDKLESIFEQRTAKAMNRLGVPTAKDVEALAKRVDQLAAAVSKLAKGGASKATSGKAARAPGKVAQAAHAASTEAQAATSGKASARKPARRAASRTPA